MTTYKKTGLEPLLHYKSSGRETFIVGWSGSCEERRSLFRPADPGSGEQLNWTDSCTGPPGADPNGPIISRRAAALKSRENYSTRPSKNDSNP